MNATATHSKKLGTKVLLFIALVTLVGGCTAKETPTIIVPAGAKAGDLSEMAPCEFVPGAGETPIKAFCGTLTVPENWRDPNSRLIALPVVKVPSRSANPAEPVFHLEGGPGSSNLAWKPPAWLLEKHDAILVGYRGVDGTVVLSCPEVDKAIKSSPWANLFSTEKKNAFSSAAQQCVNRLAAAGIDLEGYQVSGVIADMEAARKALGIEKVNLHSGSYGTRIAQLYAYRHPESIHRIVMVGLNTPGHFIFNRNELDAMFHELGQLCTADPNCSQRTSDLAQTIYNANRNAPDHWLFLPIDLDMVRFATQAMMFSTSTMPLPLDMYLSAGEGDYSGMAFLSLFMKLQALSQVWGDSFYKGGSLDLEYYQGVESVNLGNTILGAPLAEFLWQPVGDLSIPLDDPDLRVLQQSQVDMLIVNGSLDFSTPPAGMNEARPYWHNAKFVLLPKFSHVGDVENYQPAAYERLITRYYDTGTVDTSLFTDQPISFRPQVSLALLAKLLVTASLVLPIILAFILRRLIRKLIQKH